MSKIARFVFTLVLLAMFATSLVACGGGSGGVVAPTAQAPAAKIKVGLSFSDFATERWKNEEVLMRKLLEDKGYEVISQEANHDVKAQNDQIDNMVSQGVKALVVVAEDGDAIVTSVDKAADAGVKVVAYDRLIKTSKISAYLSFDNVEVGRQQALGVMKAIGADTWDVAAKGKMRVIQLAGSPTDNNATLFTKGQTEILKPYVDKGVIDIIAQQGVENWDAANALKLMENLLTAANNKVDAVVASNDGTALGALQAMKAQGLAGIVPISGQDATADGSNSIVKGELTVSILKDIRLLSPLAIDVVDKLLKGQPVDGMKNFTLAELTVDPSKKGEVPCVFLKVQQVNKDNVYDLVVKSGFQSYDDVYRDIPADKRPAKPGEAVAPAGGKIKVGLSFSDFATERWKNEEVLMRKLLEDKGYEVISQEANHDVKLQNDQIDNMVAQGVKALVVIAEDGDAAVTAVDKAADAGVKVVAYDRLIKTSKISAYLSFDNVEVGRQQALGVMKAIGLPGSTTWTKDNPAKVIQLAGSPTDNNATLFTKGQTEVLKPYIDSGVIKIIAQQGVENWDAANALKLMENLLTAANNKVDAVVASNDGTALGALQAMKAQGLAGKVPISGQDATADGSNSIVKGELTVSILKDIRNLSPLAIDVVDKLLKGQPVDGMKNFTLAELTVDPSKTGEVPCVFLKVQQVNKDNVDELVVKSGFQSYDDVYRDIPADKRPAKPGEAVVPTGPKIKVGLSFSDFATERWKNEEVLMRKLLEDKGYEVISQEANHDVKLQNDQIDNMVAQGVKALIVIAEDGDAAVTAVDKAADAGVKVIAYDRLIKTSKISAYLSFDNVEVGRQQALGVMKAIGLPGSTTWTKDNPAKVIQLAGSPTDNNATLFTKGQTEVLKPYIDSGVIKIIAQQGVENWDAANALKLMENLLTAANNKVDAVVASNDGTALGALQAMKAQGLAGKVPISGQDATADGSNSIVKGELTVSILKDIRLLSPLAIDVVDKLLKGQPVDGMKNFTLAELTVDPSKTGEVPCVFLQVQQVNKDNVYDLVVKSGFQSYDDVYRDIPEAQRPPKP